MLNILEKTIGALRSTLSAYYQCSSRHSMYCKELLLFSLKCLASKSTLDELTTNTTTATTKKETFVNKQSCLKLSSDEISTATKVNL